MDCRKWLYIMVVLLAAETPQTRYRPAVLVCQDNISLLNNELHNNHYLIVHPMNMNHSKADPNVKYRFS